MRIANIIAYILVIVGALNWGLFGFFNFNLVSSIFSGARTAGSIITYALIAAASLWLILSPMIFTPSITTVLPDEHTALTVCFALISVFVALFTLSKKYFSISGFVPQQPPTMFTPRDIISSIALAKSSLEIL